MSSLSTTKFKPAAEPAAAIGAASNATDGLPSGLTSDEAGIHATNSAPTRCPIRRCIRCVRLSKFWAPVPWMLEAAIVLEVALGKYCRGTLAVCGIAMRALLAILVFGTLAAAVALAFVADVAKFPVFSLLRILYSPDDFATSPLYYFPQNRRLLRQSIEHSG